MNQQRLPRGLRNNNPGNIRRSDRQLWKGEDASRPPRDADFAVFTSMAYGYRALMKLLRNYGQLRGCETVEEVINRFAPPVENSTRAYVARVCRHLEVPPYYRPDWESRADLCDLAAAISEVENGRPARRRDVEAGYELLMNEPE